MIGKCENNDTFYLRERGLGNWQVLFRLNTPPSDLRIAVHKMTKCKVWSNLLVADIARMSHTAANFLNICITYLKHDMDVAKQLS